MRMLTINSINKWFLLFLILYSADGISFFNHNVTPIATIFLFAVSFYWLLKNRVPFNGFIILMIPWFVYCLLSFIYFGAVRPMFFIILPTSFLGVYVLIKSNINMKMIFNSYERIIFILAKISLFFFSWQVLNKSSLISFISFFDFNVGNSYNNILYTIHHRSIVSEISQNSGFAWEPGPFSCFLILSLVIYLLQTNFKLDRRGFIYVITILSTFSTTGYLSLMILFIWYVYLKNRKHFFKIVPLALLLTSLFYFNTSILNEKIFNEITTAESELEFYIDNDVEKQTSIGRFNGFLLNLKDFKRYPILGYGGNFISTFAEENNLKITSTMGLGNYLAQYGIVGFIFLITAFYRSSFFISNLYKIKGFLFLFLIYLTMCFSFNLIEKSVFILFFFIYYINQVKFLK